MKKIGTITFHASYNHGSCLQAYALQKYIQNIASEDISYEIINLRTPIQKEMYMTPFEKKGLKNLLKSVVYFQEKKNLKSREEKYENFIKNKLLISKEFSSLDELQKQQFNYDYFISGSDQLWNLRARDFDWSNFLEFTDSTNKISYAASFGPKNLNLSIDEKHRIINDLNKYKYISVRDEASLKLINDFCESKKNPIINVDPTLLLSKEEWLELVNENYYTNEKYILLYDLKCNKDILDTAKKISKVLKMPILIVKENIKTHIKYNFKHEYSAGPQEFLSLINNAELVLSSSFHGTIFSIIMETPFYSINGSTDNRINTLLKRMNLLDRSISLMDFKKCKWYKNIDFKESKKIIEEEKNKSKEFLKKSLNL